MGNYPAMGSFVSTTLPPVNMGNNKFNAYVLNVLVT